MNIAEDFERVARKLANKDAVVDCRSGKRISFRKLDLLSGEYARGLVNYGIDRGDKTLLMSKPSIDFFALVFALFKIGAPPVIIDPGMGSARLLHCIQQAAPTALIGIPLAHLLRFFRPRYFKSVKYSVVIGRKIGWNSTSLAQIHKQGEGDPLPPVVAEHNELAAVLFTTGSTGPAKGVEYTHSIFCRQCELIREIYGVTSDDIDLACYPLFALFSVGLGMTAVVPKIDPARPASVNPQAIISAIQSEKCSFSFGSPTLWGKVGDYAVKRNIKLPSLRKVLMAGCPVPPATHEKLLNHVLSVGAETHAPYGATESLPVCDLSGSVVLAETSEKTRVGKGYCVGAPVCGVTVKIIKAVDQVLPTMNEVKLLPNGQIGEIIVKGVNVTTAYHRLEQETARAKIVDRDTCWHRLGDLGYFDDRGRVWFCGRVAHQVVTAAGILYSACCEAIFNNHPQVKRSALIGLGAAPHQVPMIIIETVKYLMPAAISRLRIELLELAKKNSATQSIERIAFQRSLPVDIRHNAKIDREKLRLIYEAKYFPRR